MNYRILLAAAAGLLLVPAISTAQGPGPVPILFNYQGRVAVDGVNFDSATAGRPGKFHFALATPDGPEGTLYWRNSGEENGDGIPDDAVELTVTKGLYSVMLGDVSIPHMAALPQVESTFAQPDLRLRVWFDDGVHGAQRLTPDQRLAPAAYFADRSIKRDAIGPSEILTRHLAAGAVESANIAPGAIRTEHFYPGSLDFSILKTRPETPPTPGSVLGFDGGSMAWTTPSNSDGIWARNGTNDAYYSGGKVGVGTPTPDFKLVVADAGVAQLGFSPTYGIRSGYLGNGTEFDGGDLQMQGGWSLYNGGRIRLGGNGRADADRNVVQFFQNSVERMRINDGGNVGIGTAGPQARLHLYEPDNSASLMIETGGETNSWSQVQFRNAVGEWSIGTSRNYDADGFYVARSGQRSYFNLPASGFEARFAVADFYLGHPSRLGHSGRALVDFVRGGKHTLVVNFGNDWEETVIGGLVTEVKTLRITGGADLAEPFEMREEELEKGSVVVIDDDHPGRLKRSAGAYDTRVAGIISGANGVNPGIALHQEGVIEGGQNVALTGRVYVQADASCGPIKPGDLLTTSDLPGHAMKVTDHAKAQGAVIGKAMSSLKEGTGMVLVLVSLQ